MRVLLLGPFAIRDDHDRPVDLSGARLRALVARLALEPGREVPADSLTDAVWDGDAPSANALQALVSRVRRVIGADRLLRGAVGYRLVLDPDDVDVLRFERLAASGRRGGDLASLREAEGLWRGPAMAGLLDLRFAQSEAVRLERLRSEATRERLALDVVTGGDVLAELEPLAAAHPLDERWQLLLMRALYATGRPAEALDVFERTRERLADELGADPSAELAELHLQILRQSTGPAERVRRRSNLKAQLTSFVGRESDMDSLAKAVAASRLVTVTGPGGAGKTRLAVEAAARIADDVAPQGVWLVELASVADDADVAPAVLRAIGAREAGLLDPSQHDAASRLAQYFADQRALLVLDNCEHRIDAAAALASTLLSACPDLRVLATSREALGIGGERLYPIPPLRLDAERPEGSPAVRLFCERAAAVRPEFTLGPANVEAVVEICRRLDGLPLAVELAAARMRALDAAQIAARLDDRFALLAGTDRAAPARHRTLGAVIAWSWDLLADAERALAMRISLYPGGIGLDRIGDIDALAGLVDKSLVELDGDRYRMLETIRAFAEARLDKSLGAHDEREAMRRYCLDLAERSDAELRAAAQIEAMQRLSTEHANLLAALQRSLADRDAETALRLYVCLFWYWHLRGLKSEFRRWTAAVLSLDADVPPSLRPAAKVLEGMALGETGELDRSEAAIKEGLRLAGGTDGPVRGRALLALGPAFLADPGAVAGHEPQDGWERGIAYLVSAAVGGGEPGAEGIELVERAEAEFEAIGERWGLASALRVRAEHWSRLGERRAGEAALERAARLFDELGTARDAAETHAELAVAYARGGAIERATASLKTATDLAAADREPLTVSYVRSAKAQILLAAGDLRDAVVEMEAAEEALDGSVLEARMRVWGGAFKALVALREGDAAKARGHIQGLQDRHMDGAAGPDLAAVARIGAAVALEEGDARHAAALLGVAETMLGTEDGRGYDAELRTTERVRESLGHHAFERARAEGAALDREKAVTLLRQGVRNGRA